MNILKKVGEVLTKQYGTRDKDRKSLIWVYALMAVLIVANLSIQCWGYGIEGNSGGFAGYLVAAMWALMAFCWFILNSLMTRQLFKLIDSIQESYKSALDGWDETMKLLQQESGYSTFLEEKLASSGWSPDHLREEYANSLSTSAIGKPLE